MRGVLVLILTFNLSVPSQFIFPSFLRSVQQFRQKPSAATIDEIMMSSSMNRSTSFSHSSRRGQGFVPWLVLPLGAVLLRPRGLIHLVSLCLRQKKKRKKNPKLTFRTCHSCLCSVKCYSLLRIICGSRLECITICHRQ